MSRFQDLFAEAMNASEQRFKAASKELAARYTTLERMDAGKPVDWHNLDTADRYATRLDRLGMHDEAEMLRAGQPIDFNPQEAIIGANQLQGIAFFERGLIAARAVARVNIVTSGQVEGYGTGFLVSPDLLLTNHHVLWSEDVAAKSFAEFDYLVGASRRDRAPIRVTLEPKRFFVADKARDYALVAISEGFGATRGWLPLIRDSGKATAGEFVNIIQHPGGERMQIVVRDNRVIDVPDGGFFMKYEADTLPGSSGSPVMNDQWELACLHHAGVPRRDARKRILLIDGSIWNGSARDRDRIDWMSNEGTRISEIVKHVETTGLAPASQALWTKTVAPYEFQEIWDLFDAGPRRPPEPPNPDEDYPSSRRESDGSVSYYFRVNFGPAGGGVPAPEAGSRPARIAAGSGPTVASTARPKQSSKDVREAARALLEDYAWQEDYYDADADAADQEDYYAGMTWSGSPRQRYDALHDLLESTHTTPLSYNKARLQVLYPAADLHPDGRLRHIYSGKPFDAEEAITSELMALVKAGVVSESAITGSTIESLIAREADWEALEEAGGLPYNCEHVVPQSWFDRAEPMRGDLHHLFTCETTCNSFRGNLPYWQFSPTEAEMQACGRREANKFEPREGKGAVARATLYFLVRYPKLIGDANREMRRDRLSLLINWHRNAPPTLYEQHRNRVIFKSQGNRNPFIDKPDWSIDTVLSLGFS